MKLFFGALEGGGRRKQRSVGKGFEGYATKLSDALLDIAEPLLPRLLPTSTAAQAERLALLAAIAWNAELADELDADERAIVERALREAPPDTQKLLDAARERKRTLYADDDRLVLGVEVTGSAPSFRFRAAGTSLRATKRATRPPLPSKPPVPTKPPLPSKPPVPTKR